MLLRLLTLLMSEAANNAAVMRRKNEINNQAINGINHFSGGDIRRNARARSLRGIGYARHRQSAIR